ncbi:hypothetical protein CFAM422_000594 [Trichoderma lentiforme]|uniref:Nucleoside phosphorylase domain-containing protein n=1 Tax=Trichoderma lentiforme TaxID=1567552 RepID=A0A9P4XQS5_9HYPO|nr:hypothetical protein CFAM422_000594 [Trichoderma lentiforme]
MSNPNDYTVGWICAITIEYAAAQDVLDETHEGPETVSPYDNNTYTLGRIGKHNVVIAALPDGEYGTSSAARVAADLSHSFPNVRFGLLVGVGGGAPSRKHDIRLGDVVVSSPDKSNGGSNGGVFQYDFGRTIQGQSFQTTGFLDQPPRVLRAAVTGIQANYLRNGHKLKENINAILDKNLRLQNVYPRPSPSSDRLYQSHVCHPMNEDSNCAESCGNDLILRPARAAHENDPMIHYGLIASANQLVKDAVLRDKLVDEKNVKCFEMEAAGLMNHFPCLVIRGICDYSDSHKNQEWQGYAAMVAAMYAKDLIYLIPPNRVQTEKKISDILSEYRDVAREHRDVAKEHLDVVMEDIQTQEEERHRQEEESCHQLFRLTRSDRDATYEWYKDRVEKRVENTCLWFLQHEHFQMWVKQDSGPLLVSADPGCGKSVLARHLVDAVLPRPETTVCYFFFKDQDQNTVRQALCALLHQLFSQKPCLVKHAVTECRKDGPGLVNSTNNLWDILQNAIGDPQAGSVIIVLDALDECIESEFTDLIHGVERQFRSSQSGKLKYLLTCRPYKAIISEFYDLKGTFPEIHIPGEEESEAISHEIDHVIQHRLNQLSKIKSLSADITEYLKTRLQKIPHRTYLWIYLVFDYLEKENFKKTLKGVEATLISLPQSVNEAYERILSKSKEDPMVRKVLTMVFGAHRPLLLDEMNEAVNFDISLRTVDHEPEEDFKSRLRSWCGLFISIYHNKIYFLHQTAREFLQQSSLPATIPATPERWQHSISDHQAHAVLVEISQAYLLYTYDMLKRDGPFRIPEDFGKTLEGKNFLCYAAMSGIAHAEELRTQGTAVLPGSVLQAATRMEISKQLNALATMIGGYCCRMIQAPHFDYIWVFNFLFAIAIAIMAVYSMPPDHPSRAAMLSNFDNHQQLEPDSTEPLDSIFHRTKKILETIPQNHTDRVKLLQSLADGLRERPLRTAYLNNTLQVVAILREIIYTIPQDHPGRSILLNSLGDCLSKRNLLSDQDLEDSPPQVTLVLWKSISMIPLHHPDRLIILDNVLRSVESARQILFARHKI